MPVITGGQVIEGGMSLTDPGAPVGGTDEVQTLTIDATGGTFKLKFEGFTTEPITWVNVNATLIAAIDAALEALNNIPAGGVTTAVGAMTAGVGTATITFAGGLAKRACGLITVVDKALTGNNVCTVAETTPGVAPSGAGAPKGATLTDTTNGKLYINTGTPTAPTWTVVGTQT